MTKRLVVSAFALAIAALPIFAQAGKEPNVVKPGPQEKAAQAPAQPYQLAAQLQEYGEKNKSGLALLTAARILRENPLPEAKPLEKTSEALPGKPPATQGPAKGDKPDALNRSALLASAKKYAAGDRDLLAMISREERTGGTRSADGQVAGLIAAVAGASTHYDTVKALDTDVYKFTFQAGQPVTIFVAGDGDTDLDISVQDQWGNTVVADSNPGDDCMVMWYPKWTGTFVLRIANLGLVPNRYLMVYGQ